MSKTFVLGPSRRMKQPSQPSPAGSNEIGEGFRRCTGGKRGLLATGDAFTPFAVKRAPDKIETGGGEDHPGRPLRAAFLSIGSAGSPARSLRAYLLRRMRPPAIVDAKEYRFPGAVRVFLGITLALGSWALLIGGIWLAVRYITG